MKLFTLLVTSLLIVCMTPAFAQTVPPRPAQGLRIPLPIDPLGLNKRDGSSTGDVGRDILNALDAKVLPDLKYALARAKKTGSKVTAPCYEAWITIIEARQAASTDDQGNPLPMPDPHVITSFEDAVELRNALQPDSDFMRACSPVASMVRTDILRFIGMVLGGGAGLAALVPGL